MSVIEDPFIYPRAAEGGPAQRVERTDLWRFAELERTIAALTERVAALEQERDTLKNEVRAAVGSAGSDGVTADTEPYVESRESIASEFVDSTPDGGYAIRILRAYWLRAFTRWQCSGLSPERTAIYERMDSMQEARAAELAKAIEILRDAG